MSKNFVFEHNGEQKNIYVSSVVEVGQFCGLLKSVFNLKTNVSALQDVHSNIYDLNYFCTNLNYLHDRFFILITAVKRRSTSKHKRHRKNNSSITS